MFNAANARPSTLHTTECPARHTHAEEREEDWCKGDGSDGDDDSGDDGDSDAVSDAADAWEKGKDTPVGE